MVEKQNLATSCMQVSLNQTLLRMCSSQHSPFNSPTFHLSQTGPIQGCQCLTLTLSSPNGFSWPLEENFFYVAIQSKLAVGPCTTSSFPGNLLNVQVYQISGDPIPFDYRILVLVAGPLVI